MSLTFKKLDLLEYILNKKHYKVNGSLNVAIISVQHLVESTGSLFESITRLGIDAQNILVMGKLYSNNTGTIRKIRELGIKVQNSSDSEQVGVFHDLFIKDCKNLWEAFIVQIQLRQIQTVIILDDGGNLISTVPDRIIKEYCVIGIEQTTSGIELNKGTKISIVSVAGSALKRYIEPAFISQAVIQKAKKYLLSTRPKSVGIFGLGNIGKALAKDLLPYFPISIFDIEESVHDCNNSNLFIKQSPNDLYYACDFIIGATGKDVSKEEWLKKAKGSKSFISVSSGDVEFRTLLTSSQQHLKKPIKSLVDDVIIETEDGYELTIFRGGTPINFDNNLHSVLPEFIQLTRALLLLGVIQAIENSNSLCDRHIVIKLDPVGQREILKHWKKTVDYSRFNFNLSIEKLANESEFVEEQSLGHLHF